jgi:TetR/AcrR family transcriptional regulator, transcriptional repressor for nem operon
MPRTTQAEFKLTQQKIVKAAAAQLRKHGVRGVSLAKVMGDVGQTVGGYYNHFPSRQALVLEAFELAMDEQTRRWQRACEKADRELAARAIVAEYLSPRHRDNVGNGCPLPALAADIGREDIEIRRVFANKLEEMLQALADRGNSKRARQQATALIASMLGAVVLARACAGTELSAEILAHVREQLLSADRTPAA